MRDLMHQCLITTLNDGTADYQDAAGNPLASGIAVMVDRNLERAGADGMFISIPLAISWRKSDLTSVGRGGIFMVGTERYCIEHVVSDDGHFVTASCQEVL